MKVVAVCGTDKSGMTKALQDEFLAQLGGNVELTSYTLPGSCGAFCSGCMRCIEHGEAACKDAALVQKIAGDLLAADLLIFSSPTYVLHATGAMKAFLDHLAYLWIAHRPAPEMFSKQAVVLTQCVGAGARSAARDIRHSLAWWGVPRIHTFSMAAAPALHWDDIAGGKRRRIRWKLRKIAGRCRKEARAGLRSRLLFLAGRLVKKKYAKDAADAADTVYWREKGWLGAARPWKTAPRKKPQD